MQVKAYIYVSLTFCMLLNLWILPFHTLLELVIRFPSELFVVRRLVDSYQAHPSCSNTQVSVIMTRHFWVEVFWFSKDLFLTVGQTMYIKLILYQFTIRSVTSSHAIGI